MGAKREYTAIFAIGGRLLGSFKGAMAMAQARMRGLQAAAVRMGAGLKRVATGLLALGGVFATFMAANIIGKIFSTAVDEAIEAEQRTRDLTASLMGMNQIRKGGEALATKQVELIFKANQALQEQGVLHKDILDTAAVGLARMGFRPKQIVETTKRMADLLVKTKGVRATEEDAAQLSFIWGKAIQTGQVRQLARLGIILDQKMFKALSKQERQNLLLQKTAHLEGINAKARNTALGQIQLLTNYIHDFAQEMGDQVVPAQAEMATAWREVLVAAKPFLMGFMQGMLRAATMLAHFVRDVLLPAWRDFMGIMGGPEAQAAYSTLSAAWNNLVTVLGPALAMLFQDTAFEGQSFGQMIGTSVVAALNGLAAIIQWVADNAMSFIINLKAGFITLKKWWDFFAQSWIDLGNNLAKLDSWLRPAGEAVRNLLLSPIKLVLDTWNKVIGAISSWRPPSWMPFVGRKAAPPPAVAAPPGGLPPPDIPEPGTLPGYQLGGIVRRPTLASLAERGAEAVIPLAGGRRAEGLLNYASRMMGGAVGRPAATSVSFAPVITINGNATETEQRAMDSRLRDLARDFVKQFTAAQYHERRLSYEGGYA